MSDGATCRSESIYKYTAMEVCSLHAEKEEGSKQAIHQVDEEWMMCGIPEAGQGACQVMDAAVRLHEVMVYQ